jgi:carbamoyltransferase
VSVFILGVNSAFHESSACLIDEGQIVAAVEEERFNRIKHAKVADVDNAHQLPWQSIDFCLTQGGITPQQVTHIGYSLDPVERWKQNRDLPDTHLADPEDFGSPEGEEAFYRSNLEAMRLLKQRFSEAEFHFIEHHLCHAASAYLVSPFEEAAILAVDGIGEFHSTWLGVGRGKKIERICRIPYPHSLGFLWEKMSELLGFDAYSGPGKMMGYGCITDPIGELTGRDHLSTLEEIVRLNADGSFWIDNEVMRFRTRDFSELERRFGARRRVPVDRYEEASIAAALQRITEETLINLTRGLHRLITERLPKGSEPPEALCMAGGVALNCVANDRILRRGPFSSLWVQPAANDAGTALGAAAYLHCQILELPGRPRMEHAFMGPAFDEGRLQEALIREGLPVLRSPDIASEAARRIDEGQIVAWFQGALEFGPRALGHRSILADPTRFDMRTTLNHKVKQRESFRPFAPSVSSDCAPIYFDLMPGGLCADYMLLACPLREDRFAQVLPAVVQENGSSHRSTARLHRVQGSVDPLYHRLIQSLAARNGVGAVLNTSFNIGEPIVATPEQAIRTFVRSGMDCMAIGPFLVERRR